MLKILAEDILSERYLPGQVRQSQPGNVHTPQKERRAKNARNCGYR